MFIKRLIFIIFFFFIGIQADIVNSPSPYRNLSFFYNPGSIETRNIHVILSYQNLYSGFTDPISEQKLGVSYPWRTWFFAAGYEQYHHKFLTEGQLGLYSGKRFQYQHLVTKFGLGLKTHFTKFSYPESVMNSGDPVLSQSSLSAFSVEVFGHLNWRKMVDLNLALRQLNQPEYSFDGSYQLPLAINASLHLHHDFKFMKSSLGGGIYRSDSWFVNLDHSFLNDMINFEFLYSDIQWQVLLGLNRFYPKIPVGIYYYYNGPHNELSELSVSNHGIYLTYVYSFFKEPPVKPEQKAQPAQPLTDTTPKFSVTFTPRDTLVVKKILKIDEINPVILYLFFYLNTDSLYLPSNQYYVRHDFFLDYNQSVLKTIVRALKDNPGQILSIKGIQSNIEKQNQLFYIRAQKVKSLLVNRYQIPARQIIVEKQPGDLINSSNLREVQNENAAVKLELKNQNVYTVNLKYNYVNELDNPLDMRLNTKNPNVRAVFSITNSKKQAIRKVQLDNTRPRTNFDFKNPADGSLYEVDDSINITGQVQYKDKIVGYINQTLKIDHAESIVENEKRIRVFLFDFDKSSEGNADYQRRVDYIFKELRKYNPKHIRILGFSDDLGNPSYNEQLSFKRAMYIKKELMKKGIPDETMVIEPLGERFPLVDNRLPWGRILNRRVEIIFSR